MIKFKTSSIKFSNEKELFQFTKKYFLHPFNEGVFGFSIFLIILFVGNYLTYLTGVENKVNISSNDVLLSTLGFICLFLLDILKHFKKN